MSQRRKPPEERKEPLLFYLKKADREMIEKAADRANLPRSIFIANAAIKAANENLQKPREALY